jgi:hypothetical protein
MIQSSDALRMCCTFALSFGQFPKKKGVGKKRVVPVIFLIDFVPIEHFSIIFVNNFLLPPHGSSAAVHKPCTAALYRQTHIMLLSLDFPTCIKLNPYASGTRRYRLQQAAAAAFESFDAAEADGIQSSDEGAP